MYNLEVPVLILYQNTKGYFCVGFGKLDTEVTRNTHARPILAFSEAVELG